MDWKTSIHWFVFALRPPATVLTYSPTGWLPYTTTLRMAPFQTKIDFSDHYLPHPWKWIAIKENDPTPTLTVCTHTALQQIWHFTSSISKRDTANSTCRRCGPQASSYILMGVDYYASEWSLRHTKKVIWWYFLLHYCNNHARCGDQMFPIYNTTIAYHTTKH